MDSRPFPSAPDSERPVCVIKVATSNYVSSRWAACYVCRQILGADSAAFRSCC